MPIFPGMIAETCPICGQDWVYVVRVIPLNREPGWICPECDAFWDTTTHGNRNHHESYGTYMEQRGLKGTLDNLEIISPKTEDFDPITGRPK